MGTKKFPFQKILAWYQQYGRHDLPWRQVYGEPVKNRLYKVWIAEVMLQQTQVDRVTGFYNRFLEKYPTIESLALTTYDELFPYYQGLGYYGRARRMIELAQSVVEKYNGVFPDDFETLRKLSGIGEYTAQALLAFGYDKPVLAMDANLVKIFARYYFGNRYEPISDTLVEQLEHQLQKENISGRDINNALMDFGALISISVDKVDRENYPLKECLWFTSEGKMEPKKRKNISRHPRASESIAEQGGARHGDPGKSTARSDSLKKGKSGLDSRLRGNDGNKKIRHACLVFLHEAHKSYWSSISSHYEPFLIEPTSSDNRRTIQDYFSATFGLEVSVRPSFGSGVFEGMSVKLFHAQIQTGTLKQKTFSKKDKDDWVGKKVILRTL